MNNFSDPMYSFDLFLLKKVSNILRLNEGTLDCFHRLKIFLVKDLLFYKPLYYVNKKTNPERLNKDEDVILDLDIAEIKTIRGNANFMRVICSYKHSQQEQVVNLLFFKLPQKFILSKMRQSSKIRVEGKLSIKGYDVSINHPKIIFKNEDNASKIAAVYGLTYGITSSIISKHISSLIEIASNLIEIDDITNEYSDLFIKKYGISPNIMESIKNVHFPNDLDNIQIYNEKICMFEFLYDRMKVVSLNSKDAIHRKFLIHKNVQNLILQNLGYELTADQLNSLEQIEKDQQEKKMNRLLQGDVGVGKTLVALLSAINVALNGVQVGFMVPLDLLANQHFQFFKRAIGNLGLRMELLTSSVKQKDKKRILEELKLGAIDILIGTHSLLQSDVEFKDLGYVIIDEQHRFGVNQRLELIKKGNNLDVLIMTATPIPRSLALSIFGGFDNSKISKGINGRKEIKTTSIEKSQVEDLINKLQDWILKNENVFWICPLIEKNEAEKDSDSEITKELQDVMSRFSLLNQRYAGKVGFISGKSSQQEISDNMQKFIDKEILIMVATTVIEVGIDVKDATLMVIEDAQNFGLSQLHQLRGRVGRNNKQSYCVLIYNKMFLSKNGFERLKTIKQTNDGFLISEKDMSLRGYGEVLGVRQSGNKYSYDILDSNNSILNEVIEKYIS